MSPAHRPRGEVSPWSASLSLSCWRRLPPFSFSTLDRRYRMHHSKQLVLVAVAWFMAIATPAALAQQAAPQAGTWRGALSSPAKEVVSVDATFDSRSVSLHFDEPYNCRLVANVLTTEAAGTRYRFKPSQNGGAFCDRLYPGDVVVAPATKKITLSIQVKQATTWTGDLTGPDASP
jgi:hypothetical protein